MRGRRCDEMGDQYFPWLCSQDIKGRHSGSCLCGDPDTARLVWALISYGPPQLVIVIILSLPNVVVPILLLRYPKEISRAFVTVLVSI